MEGYIEVPLCGINNCVLFMVSMYSKHFSNMTNLMYYEFRHSAYLFLRIEEAINAIGGFFVILTVGDNIGWENDEKSVSLCSDSLTFNCETAS